MSLTINKSAKRAGIKAKPQRARAVSAITGKKTTRIDVRVRAKQKEFLLYAASLTGQDLTAFVVTSAVKAAEEVVAEKAHFTLDGRQWKAFCAALDRPSRVIPELKKLFEKQSVFNE